MDVSRNKYSSFDISGIDALETFDISHNRLSGEIPSRNAKFNKNLKEFNAASNEIVSIQLPKNLETIRLGKNNLTRFPGDEFPNLDFIDLQHNLITTDGFDEFTNTTAPKLKTMYLPYNDFSNGFPEGLLYSNIVKLILSAANLQDITVLDTPETPSFFKSIRYFNIASNNVSSITTENDIFKRWPNIEKLRIYFLKK